MEFGDWLIDARKRWHEGDPASTISRWRVLLGSGTVLLAAAAIVERLVA
jgi:hypothetical protein